MIDLFSLSITTDDLVDEVYFYVLDHCQHKYMHASEIADALNSMHAWDINKTHVYSAIKAINQMAVPKYQYAIHSDTKKGYAIMSGDKLTAPMKQCLGLLENIAKSGKDLRLFYFKLNSLIKSTEVLAVGQQDFSGNVYKQNIGGK